MAPSAHPSPYEEQVLEAVESVPAGSVVTYGDVAELVGKGGPRQVGAVLARFGGGVPWHRVVRADGTPAPPHVAAEALRRLRDEGVPLRPGGERVDLRRARWSGPAA